jgi:glycosyltransferase involved in cell wall biosynthesis
MPVYNEGEVIVEVVDKWVRMLDGMGIDYRFSVYNDGSTDRTTEVLANTSSPWSQVTVYNKENSGHGPTILAGYVAATDDAQWVFQMDSDDEIAPECFGGFWERREEYDFLIGRRISRGRPLARRLISGVSRWVVQLFYGGSVRDVNCPYRLMRVSAFADCFRKIPAETFAPNVVVTGYAAVKKLRTCELDVPYTVRQTGTVSIRRWKLLKAAARSMRQTLACRRLFVKE